MSTTKEYTHLAQIKKQLADKYFSLAGTCKGSAKRRAYLYRAERYSRQAEVFSRKAQAK